MGGMIHTLIPLAPPGPDPRSSALIRLGMSPTMIHVLRITSKCASCFIHRSPYLCSHQGPVPEVLASQARERDRGLCCFTGRPSACITWVIPPLLSWSVPVRLFVLCLH